MNANEGRCPCGSGAVYGRCCGVWHAGLPATDAQTLMRSRYTAFVLRDAEYLLATWHPSRRPRHVGFNEDQNWLDLRILDAKSTGPDAAEVEFLARSRVGTVVLQHRERSRFVREGGRWFYVDGDVT